MATAREREGRSTVSRQYDIPEAIWAVGKLANADYVDLFTATATNVAVTSPEGWARAAFEKAPRVARFVAWRVILGLRLASTPSPNDVAGWKIAERGDGWIRIEARSWFMTAHCVFHVDDRRVAFATFVRYDRRIGGLVWRPVSAVHRKAAVGVLRRAVKLHRASIRPAGA
jgi:hypothetical protein